MNTSTPSEEQGTVATYASIEGAELAVTHLVGLGYDEHDVGIAPRDFVTVDPHPLRRRVRRWGRFGIVLGAATMTVVALAQQLTWRIWLDDVLPSIGLGAIAGVAIGIVAGLVAHRRQRRHQTIAPPTTVAPTTFEVVVGRDPERARHGLARWWDPAAPPARWQQPVRDRGGA